MQVQEKAPAKINLALHITGKRADGYHLLDSLVAFADLGDVLHLQEAHHTSLHIEGPFAHKLHAEDEENLILRAIAGLRALLPHLPHVKVTLEKHLPISSGIGGGSADAAAAIRGLLKMTDKPANKADIQSLALSLGADVPVCLAGETCRMRGIGEDLEPFALGPFHALLVNPGKPCSTKQVFAQLNLQQGFAPIENPQSLETTRNDLEAPAIQALPIIGEVLQALRQFAGVQLVRMSGSGATCFALFNHAQDALAAASQLQSTKPQWWIKPVRLGT